MDWGILQGLGQGLQQVGGSIFKAKVLDKMKEEELIRAEQREQQRRDAVDAKTVKDTRYVQKDGAWYEQKINVNGNVIDEQLAPQSEIERLENDRRKDKVSLDLLTSQANLAGKKEASYDEDRQWEREDRGLARELTQSSIDENKAQAESARATAAYRDRGGSDDDTEEYSPGELAQMLIKENTDLEKEFTEGEEPVMSKLEYRRVAQEVIRRAAARGVDPRLSFTEALAAYKRNAAKGKPVVPAKKMYTR